MLNVVAINGSPRRERSNTALILQPFLEGLADHGADVQLFYASKLKVKPCACGELACWNRTPGECIIKDAMQDLYPRLKQAQLLILASPKYSPLPGDMQNIINRLIPLMDPLLEFRNGRTRARFREVVQSEKIVLISAGGWWERENVDVLESIVEELAENVGIQFAGTIFRPHASAMRVRGELTPRGRRVLDAVRKAA